LQETVVNLQDTVVNLQDTVVNLQETVVNMNESFTATMISVFQDLHSYSRRRVSTLKKSVGSAELTVGDKKVQFGTSHALLRKGKVATIFSPHLNLSAVGIFLIPHVLPHPRFDFAILTICPSASISSALNVSAYAIPELGDELIVYGHGDSASVWTGIVSREATSPSFVNCSVTPAQQWSGVTRICAGELIAQGHQHEGLSGAPVLNGCGYVGTAHAAVVPDRSTLENSAGIIPASFIFDFIDEHIDKLPTLDGCKLQAEAPPVASFVDCSARAVDSSSCNKANRDGITGQEGAGAWEL
jgi:hypothetical protein